MTALMALAAMTALRRLRRVDLEFCFRAIPLAACGRITHTVFMRFLPRSRRGTWLLAGALWLALCAGWWCVLPVVPRVKIAGIKDNYGFSADSRKFYDLNRAKQSVRYWDAGTGKLILTWVPSPGVLLLEPHLEIALESIDQNHSTVLLTDFATGGSAEIPWQRIDEKPEVFVTRDRRYFVIASRTGARSRTLWWDRVSDAAVAEFAGVSALNVAPDGRWLTTGADSTSLILRAPAALDELFHWDQKSKWCSVSFSADGGYLKLTDSQAEVFDLTTGDHCATIPSNRDVIILSALKQAAAPYVVNGKLELVRWDLETGNSLGKQVLCCDGGQVTREPSFDWPEHGRIVIQYPNRNPQAMSAFKSWVNQLGFGSIFEPDSADGFSVFDLGLGLELDRIQVADQKSLRVSPDGKTLAILRKDGNTVELWDIPARKSRVAIVAGATTFAILLALIARRRVRYLIT